MSKATQTPHKNPNNTGGATDSPGHEIEDVSPQVQAVQNEPDVQIVKLKRHPVVVSAMSVWPSSPDRRFTNPRPHPAQKHHCGDPYCLDCSSLGRPHLPPSDLRSPEERQKEAKKRWREKNRDHYNAKQREYQRAYRARKKAREAATQKEGRALCPDKVTGTETS